MADKAGTVEERELFGVKRGGGLLGHCYLESVLRIVLNKKILLGSIVKGPLIESYF